MFFFFGITALEYVLLMFGIGLCSSVGVVGDFDLRSLMVGDILCIFHWIFATTVVDNSFNKVLGGVFGFFNNNFVAVKFQAM